MPYHSPRTTPMIPVLKLRANDCSPVQDLKEVNRRVETIYYMVFHPYPFLNLFQSEKQIYTVLDLKEAFFCLFLTPLNQHFGL